MLHLLKCPNCKSYGLREKCSCGATRAKPKPPKYSPEDKYGEYRRKFKEEHSQGEVRQSAD
jgi:H/ACA ribonucleoprotein complex subunit 3